MLSREKLEKLKAKLKLTSHVACNEEDNAKYRKMLEDNQPLPKNICKTDPECPDKYAYFYEIVCCDLSDEEIEEYTKLKQLKSINTIKNCVVFFTVLTSLSLIGGLVSLICLLCC